MSVIVLSSFIELGLESVSAIIAESMCDTRNRRKFFAHVFFAPATDSFHEGHLHTIAQKTLQQSITVFVLG